MGQNSTGADSLAITSTTMAAAWGVTTGAIAQDGTFREDGPGQALKLLYSVLTEPRGEVIFLAGFLVVALLPQYASYAISAFFGCADAPILVEEKLLFVFWSAVKLMVVDAGLHLSHSSIGWVLGWYGWDEVNLLYTVFIASLFLGASFVAIVVYREGFGALPTLAGQRQLSWPAAALEIVDAGHAGLLAQTVFDRVRIRLQAWARGFDTWGKRRLLSKSEPADALAAIASTEHWTVVDRQGRRLATIQFDRDLRPSIRFHAPLGEFRWRQLADVLREFWQRD